VTRNQLRVGVIQSGVIPYNIDETLRGCDRLLSECASGGAKFVLLPEFFSTGNNFEIKLLGYAIDTFPVVDEWLRARSRELGITIAGACLVPDGGDVWNRFFIQEPYGSRAIRTKVASPAPEAIYYRTADNDDPVMACSHGKIGAMICAESFSPDISGADFSECSMILMAFAIPLMMGRLPVIHRRMTEFPARLSGRFGIPVLVASLGGQFASTNPAVSPVPFRTQGLYTGRSGIYYPDAPSVGPVPPGEETVLITDIEAGPGAARPDTSVRIQTGMPAVITLPDFFLLKRARRIYGTAIRMLDNNKRRTP
jgi:predicted amidohydrolase